MPAQTSTIIPTLPYAHHPKEKTLTFLHSKNAYAMHSILTSKPMMSKYYRVSALGAFTGLLTVCQPVVLQELNTNMELVVKWLLCRSEDMIYVAVVRYSFDMPV